MLFDVYISNSVVIVTIIFIIIITITITVQVLLSSNLIVETEGATLQVVRGGHVIVVLVR